jgi:hypothetical protein
MLAVAQVLIIDLAHAYSKPCLGGRQWVSSYSCIEDFSTRGGKIAKSQEEIDIQKQRTSSVWSHSHVQVSRQVALSCLC